MQKKTITISMGFDDLLYRLFGQSYPINHSSNPTAISNDKWKIYLKRITKNIKAAINVNINTDSFHRSRIDLALKTMEDSFKEGEIESKFIESKFIEGLIKLVFLLSGDIPDNRKKKVVNKDQYFILQKYRNLVYMQSNAQKARTIIEANRYDPDLSENIRKEIEDHYYFKYRAGRRNPPFIDYYKKKFPERYSKLF